MKITESVSWLTIAWFILALAFGINFFIAQADNHNLEQRYHQCSGKYY